MSYGVNVRRISSCCLATLVIVPGRAIPKQREEYCSCCFKLLTTEEILLERTTIFPPLEELEAEAKANCYRRIQIDL